MWRTPSQIREREKNPGISRAEFILWLLEKSGKIDVQSDAASMIGDKLQSVKVSQLRFCACRESSG